ETTEDFDDLPKGLIHGDLFRDNTLFADDELKAILDFSEAGKDYWLLDIAITINDFCSDWPNVALNQELYQAFLTGYQKVRKLTEDEQEVLPTFLTMAATRFWLSRLSVAKRNATEGRTGEHVLQKDPQEMLAMVKARLAE
ncbi:MAG TPA: phosphotransferase, partial [Agitococcus sp.]|nr:phosphotransferase [Agitococcus sp.]